MNSKGLSDVKTIAINYEDHLRVGTNQSIDRFSLFPGLNEMLWWEFTLNPIPLNDITIKIVEE